MTSKGMVPQIFEAPRPEVEEGTAIVLANGRYRSDWAKTTHGLVRGPSRYRVLAVVDAEWAGEEAGALLDGRPRGIPIVGSVGKALESLAESPTACVVGVATEGGTLPDTLRADLLAAAIAGLDLVSGLHHALADDPEIATAVARGGGRILDIRRPRLAAELRFWSGEILALAIPRIAVLGTDCAVGKRTTAVCLLDALRRRGLRAELVTTGQTGWLQGFRHGFLFDATPNDFVSGELEGAILTCARREEPEVILIEGQGALRHPAGPAGSELIVSAAAHGVVLQHDPEREFFGGYEHLGCRLPGLASEIALIEAFGSPVWALTSSQRGASREQARSRCDRLSRELGRPVFLPLDQEPGGDLEALAATIAERIGA